VDIKNRHCQYFINGYWQSCKLLDFHNVKPVGMIYSIEFKGDMFSVFADEIKFLNCKSEQLVVPLSLKKNADAEVIFH
jgi:hypothetical protein